MGVDIGQVLFIALFASSSMAAFLRGDRYAKLAALLGVIASVATRVSASSGYGAPEDGVFIVDLITAIGFALLANASQANWLAWCTAAQLMSVLTHLARMTLTNVGSLAYFDVAGFWSFPIMILMLIASGRRPVARADRPIAADCMAVPIAGADAGINANTEEIWLLRDLLTVGQSGVVSEAWAAQILGRLGGVGRVLSAPASLLQSEGVNERAIALLRLCRRTVRHVTRSRIDDRLQVQCLQGAVDYLMLEISHLGREEFRVLYLNSKQRLLNDEVHSIGTLAECPVYVREIVSEALKLGAASVMLAHNHPSGDCSPSPEDIAVTQKLHQALRQFDISILDHIIIASSDWTSLRMAGLMNGVLHG